MAASTCARPSGRGRKRGGTSGCQKAKTTGKEIAKADAESKEVMTASMDSHVLDGNNGECIAYPQEQGRRDVYTV